ncbi:phosphatase PAP2 family protein [Lichenihabitans sp. Uapishka_5]|uniref:phosphatase PAP2 family protein n=1 Tax=Lichenihabitans sp. Uapishka_5 TaxID=3037302 RepID=UPI0029E7E59E|nr:phosphatase PAP2 family protein [Lichenihabitans sp. Uapishka_5]MDX7950750.1 phosphatase PAP2 family protein [Lichenihabitans sp. Uapishka_5]
MRMTTATSLAALLIAAPLAANAQMTPAEPPPAPPVTGSQTPFIAATPHTAQGYSLPVLKGLASVSVLLNSYDGKAALGANYIVTGGIQTGTVRQATLLPFAEQQGQALRDAFITDGNLAQLADGLGTTLGSAYVARAHYRDRSSFTNLSPAVADLIAYANAVTGTDSNAGKYFFANGTTDGKKAVTDEALQILKDNTGTTDVFGKAYNKIAGTPGADAFGDSRPFQTEPSVASIVSRDYFGVPADNTVYNKGPISDLQNSPSYPSGHTTYGYMGSLVLAMLVPERYAAMIARGAEYGNDRILMGAHYAMDVLGGRTLATYDLAHLLANDPAYLGRSYKNAPAVADFQAAVRAARADVTKALEAACGKTMADCAREDTGRFSDPAATEAFYAATQTYGLPVVYPKAAATRPDVAKLAPEAGYLLTTAFPNLTPDQADAILTDTLGPGGGFLDDGSAFGLYSRLNLYAAGAKAAATVTAAGK